MVAADGQLVTVSLFVTGRTGPSTYCCRRRWTLKESSYPSSGLLAKQEFLRAIHRSLTYEEDRSAVAAMNDDALLLPYQLREKIDLYLSQYAYPK
jgi:hypothetical protein